VTTNRLEMILELAAENPNEPMAQYMAGNELLNAGEAVRAIEHLRRYVEMLPGGDVGAAYRLMGRAYLALGDDQNARGSFDSGIRAALAHGHGDLAQNIREEIKE
jgi:predicted Zn-dependent protease